MKRTYVKPDAKTVSILQQSAMLVTSGDTLDVYRPEDNQEMPDILVGDMRQVW